MMAATSVLDRGWGQPAQSIEGNVKQFSLADLIAMSWEQREAAKAAQAEGKLIEGDVKKVKDRGYLPIFWGAFL